MSLVDQYKSDTTFDFDIPLHGPDPALILFNIFQSLDPHIESKTYSSGVCIPNHPYLQVHIEAGKESRGWTLNFNALPFCNPYISDIFPPEFLNCNFFISSSRLICPPCDKTYLNNILRLCVQVIECRGPVNITSEI